MPRAKLRRYFRHGLFPQLIVFEAVARLGSVTRAAEELHLAQPTVSMQLKKLAAALEVLLFEQRGRKLQLTAGGQAVRELCEEMLQFLSRAEERLAEFRPYLAGAVWHGTATRLSDIYLQLFCDDPKSAEIALIEKGVDYEARTVSGFHGEPVEALSLRSMSRELGEQVGVHLLIHDHDDVRGALRRDAKGRVPRGDLAAVRALVGEEGTP